MSQIGVSTMLNRLKQSIASAKEFAQFLKKRSLLEDEHARGMKKLCRMTQENVHHADHRQGSFAKAYDEMLVIHDRMAENGQQFAASLQQMHEDLLDIAATAEKYRKGWKQSGLAAEQRLSDIEAAMRKSKAKYDSLAEEYDRVRTGESRQGGKMFGLKGPKSAAQHEEDLLRKVQAADTDYMGKVQAYQSEKATVVATTRPEAIKALQDLIRECDSGTTLQMQKFASFNEKLLLSNGLVISPLKNQAGPTRSLKEVIQAVDNSKDLEDYLTSFYSKVPPKSSEPKYERNPVLNPQQNMSMSNMTQINQQQARPPSQQPQTAPTPAPSQPIPVPQPMPATSRQGTFDISSPGGPQSSSQGFGSPPSLLPGPPRPGSQPGHERSFSHGPMLQQSNMPIQQPQPNNQRNSTQGVSGSHHPRYPNGGSISATGPPQLGALPFQSQQPGQNPSPPRLNAAQPSLPNPSYKSQPQHPGSVQPGPLQSNPLQSNPLQSVSPPSTMAGPAESSVSRSKQVFGVSLDRLYERDGLAVPMVVYQCIQAVDLYGLGVEGIYRLSGSTTHIQKLKNMFDTDSDSRHLDFRNPENFFHDVNSVAGLLKQFFRDLPDPLLTGARYQDFIEAAKVEDDVVRRDSLHAIINELPDPNYASLRALTLHLHRIMENSSVTRMNSQNLAIVLGPTLMGNTPNSNVADAGWQTRVVDTILQNTYQIFDED
ncbi:putative GTPase-activating protein [Xylariales sp. PMI_506]|nr:putative GTPase-activating protein [Xylariales sp. PMI_506]